MNSRTVLLKNELNESLHHVQKSLATFEYSRSICRNIGIKNEYSFDELNQFEALTSRFARISDLLTQKVLKTIILLLKEDLKTFIDRANFAEKVGIISSAEDIFAIRDIRNTIAHEYTIDILTELFAEVLNYSESLIMEAQNMLKYGQALVNK